MLSSVRTSSTALSVAVFFLGCSVEVRAASFLRAGQVSQSDADWALEQELEQAGRVAVFEDSLRGTFASLPKNEHGRLGHQAVRYVLHRLFVQRHGWYVKGLDPNSDSAGNVSNKEWVPSYLQARMEERVGSSGAGLRELAVLAAALEDLVRKEAIGKLAAAYEILELPEEGILNRQQTEDLMTSYFISFLIAHNLSAESPVDMHRKQGIFAAKYQGWDQAKEWLFKMVFADDGSKQEGFDLALTSQMAIHIGDRYHAYNDRECKSLKTTLMQIEDRKAGRVHLSAFYNMSMYSHWRFTERADYLRAIGALDESNASVPMVIMPNYVMGRMNCLESSSIYALCCRNECEDLMGRLEGELGGPEASPDRVAALVAAMPSDTVAAPRALSDSLRARLTQVADGNGGRVPLHSRLFAQWMHHAYPRECPYPHEFGTTSPQSPDEWMQETGKESHASEEEMREQVDNCRADQGGSEELPWSEVEEHFVLPRSPGGAAPRAGLAAVVVPLLLSAVTAAAAVAYRTKSLQAGRSSSRGILDGNDAQAATLIGPRCCATLTLVTAASWLHAAELLDMIALVLALVASVSFLAAQAAAQPWLLGKSKA